MAETDVANAEIEIRRRGGFGLVFQRWGCPECGRGVRRVVMLLKRPDVSGLVVLLDITEEGEAGLLWGVAEALDDRFATHAVL